MSTRRRSQGGGTANVSLNSSDSITGKCIQFDVTSGGLYAQFNPYNYALAAGFPHVWRAFARDYSSNPVGWQFNTYNRMSFWIKQPTSAKPLYTDGEQNSNVGTYVKKVTNADTTSDEAGGDHYYHMLNLPNNGQWTHVILNMHPDHRRTDGGDVDPGYLPYPTTDTHGTYNYFDALTRFYIQDEDATGTFLIDDIQFYQETAPENDAQVSSLTGTYDPGNNELIATWNRLKDENDTNHEVRYSFSDIHQIGWNAATPAPGGIITPPGWQGYNGMVYDTTALSLAGHSVVYIAIKPQNSDTFSQIAVRLDLP